MSIANRYDGSINQVAHDLEIHASIPGRRKMQISEDPKHAFPGKGRLKEPDEENHRLGREVECLQMENDFIKRHQHRSEGKRVTFRFINAHRGIWPLDVICRALRVFSPVVMPGRTARERARQ